MTASLLNLWDRLRGFPCPIDGCSRKAPRRNALLGLCREHEFDATGPHGASS